MGDVVVTGIGLVTPLGIGIEDNWSALTEGRSGIGPITLFDCSRLATRFAGEVHDFDAGQWLGRRDAKHLDRFLQLSLVAAELAIADAGFSRFTDEDAERVGCYVGSGFGGLSTIERAYAGVIEKGPRYGISPYALPGMLVNLAPGQISIRYNIRGPTLSHVSACSTGAHSIGEAMRVIQRGECDVMICGGAEAVITTLAIGAFNAMRALSTRNEQPDKASRPFERDRDGFVIGEGAGVLVLEDEVHARARGGRIHAHMLGYGTSCDAFHPTAPPPNGEGAQRAMRAALRDARLSPDDIGYVNAHGTATKLNDVIETLAIKRVFSDHARRLAVSSTKSMTGHLLGAAGGVECAFSALALERGVIPPTINLDAPDPECDLDYVPNVARQQIVEHALSNSFGFGGTNVCLVLGRHGRRDQR
jgi:3-oxoacyl-[acyl-carrier-protein] synthase II